MDEFSVTINSAASKHQYPNNTPASFQVTLNPAIEFPIDELWEVGLFELTYPQYWETITDDSSFSLFRDIEIHPLNGAGKIVINDQYRCSFSRGNYRTVDKVFEGIYQNIRWKSRSTIQGQAKGRYSSEKLLIDWRAREEFSNITYDPITKLVSFEPSIFATNTNQIVIWSGLTLWKTLGFFNLETNKAYQLPINGSSPARVGLSDFSAIFVHVKNLIEYQMVGDRMETLLEIVPIEAQSTAAAWTFRQQKPIYKKMISGYISHLEFDIRDHLGEHIPFQFGKVSLVLNFRKCRFRRNLEKEF